jgi:sulfite oxidase
MPIMDKTGKLIPRQTEPLNAGPSSEDLCQSEITPEAFFFVRNHGSIPEMKAADYRLVMDGPVPIPLELTLEELHNRFPRVALPATLQCAGNRRQELAAVHPIPGELPWGTEAIGTAAWGGVRLVEVLRAAGVEEAVAGCGHVAFTGLDEAERLGRSFHYGVSIPLDKALRPEVLLAWEMNGRPLAPEHGYPLRLVVPGYIGARSVKWLSRITLRATPSDNYFQAQAYRLFPPQVRPETVDWDSGLMLGECNVSSVICSPAAGAVIAAGRGEVRGYAISGGGRTVERVDVSADGGRNWQTAEFAGDPSPWTWRLWQTAFELPAGQHELVVRAVDSAALTQPESVESVWNFKGYMNNAWHRVQVTVVASFDSPIHSSR